MKHLIVALFVFSALSARAEDLASAQFKYANDVRSAVECQYALDRLAVNKLIPTGRFHRQQKAIDQVRNSLYVADCKLYPSQVIAPNTKNVEKAGPLFSEVPDAISPFSCALMHGADFVKCDAAREEFLKAGFTVHRESCPSVGQDTAILNDNLLWHNYLLKNGYECTAKEFRRLALTTPGSQDLQSVLERMTKAGATRDGSNTLRGLNIAYLPPAVYERLYLRDTPPISFFYPKEGEQLSSDGFKNGMKKLGANVRIIERVSTSPLNTQVEESLRQLKDFDRDTASSGGFIVVTRSAGGVVLTKILKESAAELPHLKAAFNVGGIPRGSVIAEFKSRWDNFFNGIALDVMKAGPLVGVIDFFDGIDKRLHHNIDAMLRAALSRENLATESFRNEDLKYSPEERKIQVPVVNYTLLNPTEATRTASNDPVYQTMLAYGPTEGSGRLADSAFESARSYRVFYDNYGHLGFRSLTPDQSIEFYLVMIQAAREQGIIR